MVEQLRAALTTRDTIGTARGILIATRGWRMPDEAFEILRQASRDRDVKLRDLAQETGGPRHHLRGQGSNGSNDKMSPR